MALLSIRDFTYWAAWEDLPLIWKHKYYLPSGVLFFVLCNSTGAIDSAVFNGVKLVVVYVAWTMFFLRGSTHEWISDVVEVLFLFLVVLIYLLSSWDEMGVPVELLADDAWAAEDDKTGFLNVGVDCFGQLYF